MKHQLNPNNIPGIYNYCDRWCERCHFTARCAVYERTSKLTPEQNDINNKAFWEQLSKNFADTLVMITEEAAKQGIDLNAIPEEEMEEYKLKEKQKDERNEKHPLIIAANLYADKAMELVKKNNLVTDKTAEIQQQVELGIIGVNVAKLELESLNDCYEIVQWYMHQLYVKLKRAMSVYDDGEDEDDLMMSDANGSAKVALIGTERSMIAWEKIMRMLPTAEDDILEILALLQKIRMLIDKQFPSAVNFKRPGLDD